MNFKVSCVTRIQNKLITRRLYSLNKYLLKQPEKVAYAYKNLVTGDFCSFNYDICFYAASSIKFLVCFYIYKEAEELLDNVIKISEEDYKRGNGVIKNNPETAEYTVRELIYYCLKESDNTAYVKLVELIGKEKIIEFGKSLGAMHTLEGNDLFGITNANDMMCFLEAMYNFFETKTSLSKELYSYMINPSYEIVKTKNLDEKDYVKKYGSFGIAFHEVGIVFDENPYILIILTQKNELSKRKKEKYINCVAHKIMKIHKTICNK